MDLAEPFYPWHEHLAIDLPGATAVFTTRRGGVSTGAYASLNLGKLTADDPDAVERNRNLLQSRVGGVSTGPYASLNLGKLTADDPEAVEQNRNLLQSRAGGRLAMIRQVHGPRVVRRDAPSQVSGPNPAGELDEADGQVTAMPAVAPMVTTADCLPIAVAGGGALAMLHAGWRGLAEGVIAAGLRELRELTPGTAFTAAIGPGAGACCYEVGDEVRECFADYGTGTTRGRNLDLKAIARAQLEQEGVDQVHDIGLCTICSPATLFFSHRRDHGVTGRQAGIAWLT